MKTYSAPFATRSYAKEFVSTRGADGSEQRVRDFPRLKFGGAHLGGDEAARNADVAWRIMKAAAIALLGWGALVLAVSAGLARRRSLSLAQSARLIWCGETVFAWNAVLATLGGLCLVLAPLVALAVDYHVFGTDKVGQDVFYLVLKSVRTALIIGLVTTLVSLPFAIALGLVAGYFRGWVDDVIQYVYTTLSSIPGVLLIAASVLMIQVVIDTHPEWFATGAQRADIRLLALCLILGVTSWTSLCRLLRGEALKLRELEYVQAAQAFGVRPVTILARHLLPNVMHIVIISVVMDFPGWCLPRLCCRTLASVSIRR